MSLINQVLQDLEKRNAENAPEQHQLNDVKAVPTTHKTLYALLFAIIIIAGVIAFFAYNYETAETADLKVSTQKKSVTANIIRIASQNDKVDNIQPKQQPRIETTSKEIIKATVVEAIIVDEEKVTASAQIIQPKIETVTHSENKIVKKKRTKVLNYYKRAQQLFEQAKKKKNLTAKQRKLTQALKLDPNHIKAWLLLVNTQLQQGQTNQAAITLDHSLTLFSQNLQFINLRSQLYLQQKRPQAALNILHAVDIRYVQDETFLSLLAAAYQQNNEHIKSLPHYQKLLTINPEQAEYWLGLAIALEKQGKTEQAITAYQQAASKNTLKPVVLNYIKQRLSILK